MQPTGIPALSAALNATPADCALVIALPLDREHFLRDLAQGPASNFVHSYKRNTGDCNSTPEADWFFFEAFADHARRAIAEAAKLGVHIVERATLRDFLAVLPRFKATTVFAHYRTALFFSDDIVDARKLLLELEANNSPFSRRIVELVGTDAVAVARFLNDVIAPERLIPAAQKKPGQITEEHMAWHERRRSLEMLLPGSFQGGAAVEFVDGWHFVDEIAEAIPSEYDGVLDLTICNSTVLAEKIRRKCPRSVPLANEQEASTHFRFAVYRLLLKELTRKPEPYEDTAFRVRQKLLSSLRQKSWKGFFMGKLRSILAKYSVVAPRMGGQPGPSPEPAWNMEELRADLKTVRDKNRLLFWICVAMTMVLFAIDCGLVLKFINHPDRIKEVFSVVGLSLAGTVLLSIRLWKVKLFADMLLVLAAGMRPAEIRQVMHMLLRG